MVLVMICYYSLRLASDLWLLLLLVMMTAVITVLMVIAMRLSMKADTST